jgi:hypothetical protein
MELPPRFGTMCEAVAAGRARWHCRQGQFVIVVYPDGTFQPLPSTAPDSHLVLTAALLGGRIAAWDELSTVAPPAPAGG